MDRRLAVASACGLALGIGLPAGASANTIGVTTQADEKAADSNCSLREAISAANDGNAGPGGDCNPGGTSGPDVINLPANANPYQVTGAAGDTSNASGDLNITSDLTISGSGANTTTIQSDGQDRVINIGGSPGAVAIRDVAITRGQAPAGLPADPASMSGYDSIGGQGNLGGQGGGILATSTAINAALTLNRVVVSGNSAGNGSAGSAGGTATADTGGKSTGGAGGAGGEGGGVASGIDLTFTDSTIANNHGGAGGAGGAGGTAATGTGGAVFTAGAGGDSQGGVGAPGGSGGGIWMGVAKTLTLTRSVVQSNNAGDGGPGGNPGTPGTGGDGGADYGGNGGCACGGSGGDGGAGGGIALQPGSSVITDSTIRDNSSGAGNTGATGGVGGNGGTGGVEDGHGGDSRGGGGGNSGDFGGVELRSTSGNSQSVSNSAIFGNVTPDGAKGGAGGTAGAGSASGDAFGGAGGRGGSTAGIGVRDQTGTLTNVTIASNNTGTGGAGGASGTGADQSGGPGGNGGADAGFRADLGGDATLTHVTVANNNTAAGGSGGNGGSGTGHMSGAGGSAGQGAGVSNRSTGTLTLRNSVVSANDSPNCTGTITDGGHNLRFPVSDSSCPAAIAANPLLGPLQNYGGFTPTMKLGAGSPAISAVPKTGANCAFTDQRGMGRPQGAACDIGAFEFALPTITLSSPVNGKRYRKGAHVVASYSCREGGLTSFIVSCTGTVANLHAINTSSPGSKTFSVVATDTAGNHVTKTVHYLVDASRPTITIKTPKDGATFRKGKKVKAKYSCSDIDGRADVKSCKGSVRNGKRIPTGKTGRHTFTVVAIDRAGNRTTKTVHYKVKKKKKK